MYILETFGSRRKTCATRGYLTTWSLPHVLLLPCHPASRAGEDCAAELPWEEEAAQHLLPLRLPPLRSSACLKRMTWRECHCSAPRSDLSVNNIKMFKLCYLNSMKLVITFLFYVCSVVSALSQPVKMLKTLLNRGGKCRCQSQFSMFGKWERIQTLRKRHSVEIYYKESVIKAMLAFQVQFCKETSISLKCVSCYVSQQGF